MLCGARDQPDERRSVLEDLLGQPAEDLPDRLLTLPPGRLFYLPRFGTRPLLALGDFLERRLDLEPGDAFGARLKVQPEWTLDSDLAETEVSRGKDFTDNNVFLFSVFRDLPRVARDAGSLRRRPLRLRHRGSQLIVRNTRKWRGVIGWWDALLRSARVIPCLIEDKKFLHQIVGKKSNLNARFNEGGVPIYRFVLVSAT